MNLNHLKHKHIISLLELLQKYEEMFDGPWVLNIQVLIIL